jgi:hypothetical protein
MPEEIEVETKDLQETIQELHEEEAERKAEEKKSSWTKYVGLTTAILAVFAAVGALQSGSLVNEALMHQVKSSDTWNQYQASRQKEHLYTLAINSMLDSNQSIKIAPTKPAIASKKPPAKAEHEWVAKSPAARAKEYEGQVAKESGKEEDLSKEATALEKESGEEIEKHHMFAYSVALIQVAIALGAVSALTKVKSVWGLSMLCGAAGIVFFFLGFAMR